MTRTNATTGAQPPSTSNPPAGWRPALTLLVLLGPLSIAILRMLLPYGTGDSPAAVAAKVAADPVAEAAVLWLSLLAGFTLVPGMIAVGLLAARRSRVLGTAALVVSVAGFSGLPAIVAVDLVAQSGTRANVPADVTARLLRQLLDEPTVAVPTLVFVAGHVAGVVLLGIALWRGGILPGWAGLVVSISQPLHLVFATIAPSPILDGCAWLLTAAGLAFATARPAPLTSA
ncbi:hypothetical protein [Nonomuraea rubra]|uniref:DUF4386 family protein n=1 Tax=Nonomuraea rubra TaxID=46180 RepID=A0A7X0NY86_9ACTN|nr:hypothetical protein [Nonomuraea rubra]MBB6551785.1 hypothetical protein [Nonomuraea rubra]